MKDIFIRPMFEAAKANVSFTSTVSVKSVDYQILDAGKVFKKGCVGVCGNDISFEIPMDDFICWSVENPHLYQLVLHVKTADGEEELKQRFAMTKIEIENRKIYFNNTPLYLRGHIRGREAHDHPNFLGCSDREYYEKHIRMSKDYGFNFIRFHSRIPDEDFLNTADEMGQLCQVEIRPYYGKYQKERQSTGFDSDTQLVDEAHWTETICRLRNHPSVLVYCMGNEIDKPGRNERVKIISKLTKELDPTRLFLDTCSRGEYDRDTVDIDVQHMSYFAPFGNNYDMFDDSMHLSIYGSITDKAMNEGGNNWKMMREVPLKFPLIAHEVCHYNVLRDPYSLKKKFESNDVKMPWWVDESIKMIEAKGHSGQYEKMYRASTHFQRIWIKQCLESVRKSELLQGFHMLQFSDTDRYENANGLVDCFDDPKDIPAELVRKFNGPTVLIADLPKRSFMAGQKLTIPVHISHFADKGFESGSLTWSLESIGDKSLSISGTMKDFDLSERGNRKLCRLVINLPEVSKPQKLKLKFRLVTEDDDKFSTENDWDLWLFPDDASRICPQSIKTDLKYINLNKRYPQLGLTAGTNELMITDHFSDEVFEQLRGGKDVLMLYRVDDNRQRRPNKEKYYLPSTWDRFKGIIWDRGHNCGGFFRDHPVLKDFPYDEFIDWHMYNLVEDCDKINLDDFPVKVEPIIEGIDKASRDRFDVGRFDIPEFQYEYTMRKFGYLFEIKVGTGRLVVCGLNFKGLEKDVPECCWMFENILNYTQSDKFKPAVSIEVEALKKYLEDKGSSRRTKERMMTQYWQLDDAPLESKQYWAESEDWLREDEIIDSNSHWAYGL